MSDIDVDVDVDVDVENGVAADVDAVSSWVKVGRHSHYGAVFVI